MEFLKETMLEITEHVRDTVEKISEEEVNELVSEVLNSKRIFIYGTGRSGLVARAFAIRLTHLGFNVFVVGETITPPIRRGDTLIVISGSGKTLSVISVADAAKKEKAKVITITSCGDSELAGLASHVVTINGRTKEDVCKTAKSADYLTDQIGGKHALTPMGTMFEVTCQVFLDGVIAELMDKLKKTEKSMMANHANVE